MAECVIEVVRLASTRALRIKFPRVAVQESGEQATVTLTADESSDLYVQIGNNLYQKLGNAIERQLHDVCAILGARENESVTDAAKRVRDTAGGFDPVAVVGPLDALQIVQQDRDEWKRRTQNAELTTKSYAEDRNSLALRLERAQAELAVLYRVEKAARMRFEVWTRETYEGLDDAFKVLDTHRAKGSAL